MVTTTTDLATNKSFDLAIGGRDEIKELSSRLRLMMPNGTKFTESEALAVAQVSILNKLDPFNGEVWGIKSEKSGEWRGVMVGVKGLRKTARRQADSENSVFWTEFRQVNPPSYGNSKTGAVVFECVLRDTVSVQAWGKSLHILTTAGVPYQEAIKMLGASPAVIGVGMADPSEFSKMSIVQRAKKRAEADAIKQRYDVSFMGAVSGSPVMTEADEIDPETASASEAIEETIINGYTVDVQQIPQEQLVDARQVAYADALEIKTPNGHRLGDFNDSQLENFRNNPATSAEVKKFASLIIDHRIDQAKQEAAILGQLGFPA